MRIIYFLFPLGSNANGPHLDRYLHLGFKTSERLVRRTRVCTVWAILRVRHPMLCARVEMRGDDDAWFMYVRPL